MNDEGKEIVNINGDLKRSAERERIIYSININFPYYFVEVSKSLPTRKTLNGFIINNPY
jgi:hypothetical protein